MKREIRLHAYDPTIITAEEYEDLQKEVQSRILAGCAGISDRICLRLLEEHAWRYHEIRQIEESSNPPPREGEELKP